jgi:hypothetical protein
MPRHSRQPNIHPPHRHSAGLSGIQDCVDTVGEGSPLASLFGKLGSAFVGKRIDLSWGPTLLRDPLGLDKTFQLKFVESRIEPTLSDLKRFHAHLSDTFGDLITVQTVVLQYSKNQSR